MSALSKKTPIIAIASLLVAGSALAFIAFGNIGENLVYYWAPSEVLSNGERAYGPTIRMGGVVRQGSIDWNKAETRLAFEVADDLTDASKYVKVVSTELPPQMFREGIGVVVEGTYDASGKFTSTRLMVNHSNEYRAPQDGTDVEKMWKETVAQ